MSSSKIFLYLCLAFIGGIFFNSVVEISQFLMLAFLILGLIFISVFWKYKKPAVIGFCILFLVLGIWRHSASAKASADRQVLKTNQEIILTGIVNKEPARGEKSQKLTVKTEELKILVTVAKYPEYKYGDKLKITGKLETPSENIDGFNYRDYLKKDGIYYAMGFPKIEFLGSGFGNPVKKILLAFKNKFKETAASFISPPELGILEALVFGDESEIPKEWKEKLNLTGTRHIAAVSGMNITIISGIILNLLLAFGFWRRHAFYLSAFLLVLYILMIGAPPSAVRAGIMAGVFICAQQFGRLSDASRAIVFASSFMLALNPLLLRLDVGFQLSFLAMMGLIYLQPHFSGWLKKIPNPKIFPLRATLSATLAAQVFTLPILIYNFGYFSPFAVIPNVLIVPFLAPITILIFIFGLTGMIFWQLGWVLSWPVWLFLNYITKIIDAFSKMPFNQLALENISWIFLATSYLFLGIFVWRLGEKEKLKILNY